MATIKLEYGQKFGNRAEIKHLLGGDPFKGITQATKINAILLFTNENELYSDYFYPKGTHDFCMYTGIGRIGHQDSIQNKLNYLNVAVSAHKQNKKPLLVFEK